MCDMWLRKALSFNPLTSSESLPRVIPEAQPAIWQKKVGPRRGEVGGARQFLLASTGQAVDVKSTQAARQGPWDRPSAGHRRRGVR